MELESDEIACLAQWAQALQRHNAAAFKPEDHALLAKLLQAYARETPQVVNQLVSRELQVGDYVFASRWSDCSTGNPWYVGHIAQIHWAEPEHARPYPGYVVLQEAPARRWPHAMRITPEQGTRIVTEFPSMEEERTDFGAIARVFGLQPAVPGQRKDEHGSVR